MLFDDLTDENFELFAMKYYVNTQCTSVAEFQEDVNKIRYIKRLLNRFAETGELKTVLLLNHLVVIYNVFENVAATRMLFFSIEKKYYSVLKPFLLYLNRLPRVVEGIRGSDIITTEIPLNQVTIRELRKI